MFTVISVLFRNPYYVSDKRYHGMSVMSPPPF